MRVGCKVVVRVHRRVAFTRKSSILWGPPFARPPLRCAKPTSAKVYLVLTHIRVIVSDGMNSSSTFCQSVLVHGMFTAIIKANLAEHGLYIGTGRDRVLNVLKVTHSPIWKLTNEIKLLYS